MIESSDENADVDAEHIEKLAEEIARSVLCISDSRMSIIPQITSQKESASVIRKNLQDCTKGLFDFFLKEFNVKQNLSNLRNLREKPESKDLCHVTPLKHINFIKACKIKQKREEFEKKIRKQQEEILEWERSIENKIMRIEQQKLYKYR